VQCGADECPSERPGDHVDASRILKLCWWLICLQLKNTLRSSLGQAVGEVHSIFCNTDAPLATPLAELVANCGQAVPSFLKELEPS
jgi:hypothetical protein